MPANLGRIGFAGMHLAGARGWGPPADREGARQLLRDAVDAGIRYIDTADVLGPDISEQMVAETLFPYSDEITIATKIGATNAGPGRPGVLGHPAYLRQQTYASAFRLRLETIPLLYLHRIDPSVPLEDQIGTLVELKEEGVVGAIGLSAVSAETLRKAASMTEIAAVQNPMSVLDRTSDEVMAACDGLGAHFMAFWCFGRGLSVLQHPTIAEVATDHGVTPAQAALAWLLGRSPNVVAMPGTKNMEHMRANLMASSITLSDAGVAALDGLWQPSEHTVVVPLD